MTWQGIAVLTVSLMAGGALIGWAIYRGRNRPERTGMSRIKTWKRDKLPIMVVIDPDLTIDRDVVRAAVEHAIWWWNHKTGLPLFVDDEITPSMGSAIVPVMGSDRIMSSRRDRSHVLMFTRLRRGEDARIQSAAVYLAQTELTDSDPETIKRAMIHELGHVVGLAHDREKKSVMYTAALSGAYMLTIQDRTFLRSEYGG